MRDLSKPLAPTYGDPKKEAAPKKMKKKRTPNAEELRTATSSPVIYNTAGGGKGMYKSGSKYVNDKPKRGYDDAYKMQMAGPRSGGRKLKKSSTTISSPTSIKMGKKVTVKPNSKKEKKAFDKQGRKIKREVKKEIRQENRTEKKGKRLGERMMKSVTKKL